MLLQKPVQHIFDQLKDVLQQISCEAYRQPSAVLNGATIGQHVRHTIELFQCLLSGYEQGSVNYESRNRDITIETNRQLAHHLLTEIIGHLNIENKPLMLLSYSNEEQSEMLAVETNFYREVVYNLEHAIHHMALIRIGIQDVCTLTLKEDFGVAASTIQYRKACAQ
jgi:hypothetical protein